MELVTNPVQQVRLAHRWNRADLARHAGITASTIQRIEEGETRPHWGTITALAGAMNVDPTSLDEAMDAWLSSISRNPELLLRGKEEAEVGAEQLYLPLFYNNQAKKAS